MSVCYKMSGGVTFAAVPSFVCVFCFFNFGCSTSGSLKASVMRVLFFVSSLFLGPSKPRESLSANECLACLNLGLASSSLRSLSVDDRVESGSSSISFRERDAEVETDPFVDSGALEDEGDRTEDPNVPIIES